MRRRIFLHFLDHEILRRIATAPSVSIEQACGRLIRISSVLSIEPALFPISAQHEDEFISDMLRGMLPLIQSDLIRITGYGANPTMNLEIRRHQFSNDREMFARLFHPAQEQLVSAFGHAWVEKTGSTTHELTVWWENNIQKPRSRLSSTVLGSRIPSDPDLQYLMELPGRLEGRPILADVVAGEVAAPMRPHLSNMAQSIMRSELGTHLTREWARIYSDSLSATVFRDFGLKLPDLSAFCPVEFPTISGRESQLLLRELGILDSIYLLTPAALARVMSDLRVEREYVAKALFSNLCPQNDESPQINSSVMKSYLKLRRRRLFAVGKIGRSRPDFASGDLRKHAMNLALSFEALTSALQNTSEARVMTLTKPDRSFSISNVTGNVNISQDSSTINDIKISTEQISKRLIGSLSSEASAADFVTWLQGLGPQSTEADSSADISSDLNAANLNPNQVGLLRMIAQRLAISATSAGAVVAVIEAIKSIGA